MTLKTRWIDFLYRMATGRRRVRNVITPIGAIFFGILVLLFVVVARYFDQWIGMADLLPGLSAVLLSLPLLSTAFFMFGWSVQHFLK